MNAHPRGASPHRATAVRRVAAHVPQHVLAQLGLPALLLLGAVLLALTTNAHGALYKWTDERGITHYSDKIPPDAVNRASAELNRDGLTVRKTEQARPVAQRVIPKNDSEEQLARAAERAKVLAARRDRALIESYTSETEIDLAKTRAVATIDGQIQSAQAFIAQMQKRRAELEAKQSTYAPRPVPGEIKREIESIDEEVARQSSYITARQNESANVAARYESDKQRFRELRSGETSGTTTTNGAQIVAGGTADLQLVNGPAKP
jgi:uncharacterized protein DUF4124